VLYGIVRDHLTTFLAHTERSCAAPLPKYVVDTFDGYLACGDLARGFLRCRCEGCGHDVLVAFSCKHRSLCPSCGTRRMSNEAVQVVDRVLPNVPILVLDLGGLSDVGHAPEVLEARAGVRRPGL
jgi:hypothetical protein